MLLAAPTGSGKTVAAEFAVLRALARAQEGKGAARWAGGVGSFDGGLALGGGRRLSCPCRVAQWAGARTKTKP